MEEINCYPNKSLLASKEIINPSIISYWFFTMLLVAEKGAIMKGYVKFGSLKAGERFITLQDAYTREGASLYVKIQPIPKKKKRGETDYLGEGVFNAIETFSGRSVEMLHSTDVKRVIA